MCDGGVLNSVVCKEGLPMCLGAAEVLAGCGGAGNVAQWWSAALAWHAPDPGFAPQH